MLTCTEDYKIHIARALFTIKVPESLFNSIMSIESSLRKAPTLKLQTVKRYEVYLWATAP